MGRKRRRSKHHTFRDVNYGKRQFSNYNQGVSSQEPQTRIPYGKNDPYGGRSRSNIFRTTEEVNYNLKQHLSYGGYTHPQIQHQQQRQPRSLQETKTMTWNGTNGTSSRLNSHHHIDPRTAKHQSTKSTAPPAARRNDASMTKEPTNYMIDKTTTFPPTRLPRKDNAKNESNLPALLKTGAIHKALDVLSPEEILKAQSPLQEAVENLQRTALYLIGSNFCKVLNKV